MKTKKYLKIASLGGSSCHIYLDIRVFVPEIPAHCKGI